MEQKEQFFSELIRYTHGRPRTPSSPYTNFLELICSFSGLIENRVKSHFLKITNARVFPILRRPVPRVATPA